MISRNNWLAWGVFRDHRRLRVRESADAVFSQSHRRRPRHRPGILQAAAQAGVTSVLHRRLRPRGLHPRPSTTFPEWAPGPTNLGPVNAIDKAGTAAYLSSNGGGLHLPHRRLHHPAPLPARHHATPAPARSPGSVSPAFPFRMRTTSACPARRPALGIAEHQPQRQSRRRAALQKRRARRRGRRRQQHRPLRAHFRRRSQRRRGHRHPRADRLRRPRPQHPRHQRPHQRHPRSLHERHRHRRQRPPDAIASHYRDPADRHAVHSTMDSPNMPFHPLQTNPYPFSPIFPAAKCATPSSDSPQPRGQQDQRPAPAQQAAEVAQILNQAAIARLENPRRHP